MSAPNPDDAKLPIVQAMVRELRDMGFVVLPLGAVALVAVWHSIALTEEATARDGGYRATRRFKQGEAEAYQRMLYHLEGGGKSW